MQGVSAHLELCKGYCEHTVQEERVTEDFWVLAVEPKKAL